MLLAAGLCAVLGAGCQDDLPKATLIERMRLLGVSVSVVGDETRATPMPGESVRLSFPTVFPETGHSIDRGQLMLVSCTAPDRYTGGLPICQELIDAVEGGNVDDSLFAAPDQIKCSDIPGGRQTFAGVTVACVRGEPTLQLRVPEDFSGQSGLFLGVLCEKGEAFFDPTLPELFGCEDNDGETLPLDGTYPVLRSDQDINHNPDISLLSIEMEPFITWRPIDGTRLAQPGALPEDCLKDAGDIDNDGDTMGDPDDVVDEDDVIRTNPFLPGVEVGAHQLTIRYPAQERERALSEPGQPFESLEITVHTTFGEMERQYTLFTEESETYGSKLGQVPIDTDPPWLEEDVKWDPENDVPVTGQLVRFFVTVRDQRGGFSMSTYAACVR